MRKVLLVLSCFAASTLAAKSLDSAQWVDRAAWNCVRTIAVKQFRVTGEFKGQKTEEEYMAQLVTRLNLQMKGKAGIERVYLTREETPDADAVIDGEFLELSAGSRAARFWVGYGAGTAKCDVQFRVKGRDGREIATLQQARVAPFSLSADANESDIIAVADDVAAELTAHRASCDPTLVKVIPPKPSEAQPRVDELVADNDLVPIAIEASVENAEVWIDSKFAGNTPLSSYRLAIGSHAIEVRAAGYATWKRELEVSRGAASRVYAALNRE